MFINQTEPLLRLTASESRQTIPLFCKRYLFIGLMLMLGVVSCDGPTSPTNKSEEHSISGVNQFFAVNPDSVGPLLDMAIDTLRARQAKNPFVKTFLHKRGLPVWKASSSFYQRGKLVLQVPVRAIQQQKIMGLINILIEGTTPRYQWLSRGGQLTEALEAIMWGYEKRVFGKMYTDEGAQIRSRVSPFVKGKMEETEQCWSTCVYGACGDWHCPQEGGFGDGGNGGGDGRGFGGGPGSGGSSYDGSGSGLGDGPDSEPSPPECDSRTYKAIPDDGIPWNDYAGPSHPSGCNEESSTPPEIIVDETISNNDLTDCIYSKLSNEAIFKNLIANFEGDATNYDIKYELSETEDNAYGEMEEIGDDFVVQIDVSWLTRGRNDLEVAGTFVHETIHAEMRRYLRERQQNGSTIPGFPGSFTEDWENYVNEKFGGNASPAEHEAMAKKYIGLIADALAEYDNHQLSYPIYKAIAWDGLIGTTAWDNADQAQIRGNRYDDSIDNRTIKCTF